MRIIMPAAKFDRVSCSANPMMKPTTPSPARSGPRFIPSWDSAISRPSIITTFAAAVIIILRSRVETSTLDESRARVVPLRASRDRNRNRYNRPINSASLTIRPGPLSASQDHNLPLALLIRLTAAPLSSITVLISLVASTSCAR